MVLTFICIGVIEGSDIQIEMSKSITQVRIEIGQELVNGEYFYYIEQNYIEDEITRVHSTKLTRPGIQLYFKTMIKAKQQQQGLSVF